MRRIGMLCGLIFLLGVAFSSCFTVDVGEYAYVTRFGEPTSLYDGATDAGLHLKYPWPIDSVRTLDRRLQTFDLPPTESLTRDVAGKTIDKTLTADGYVCWRIIDADRFVRTVGTLEQAKRLLTPRLTSRLSAVLSNQPLDAIIRTADEATIIERSAKLRRQLLGIEPIRAGEPLDPLPERLRAEYGIELADVRLRRVNYPEAVRGTIAERIRSERARKAAEYLSEGSRLAAEIVSDAEREASNLLAAAKADRVKSEGQADADADAIRQKAFARDPEFYLFLQKLQTYQTMLADSKDVLLLSGKSELFDLLFKPPVMPKK